ncbi:Na+/H+ antiporter subunit E [Candidatus Margulisiibacteriota bacterium]
MARHGSRFLVFLLGVATWLLLTWKLNAVNIGIGVLVSAISALLFGELLTVYPQKALKLSRYFWFLYYVPIFLWEMLKANLDVAYRVLHPLRPINPGLVKIKTNLKSDVSKTFLANSITLTPGTMTVDIKGDVLYIHWIDVKERDTEKATQAIAGRFEKIIARIFE